MFNLCQIKKDNWYQLRITKIEFFRKKTKVNFGISAPPDMTDMLVHEGVHGRI